MREKNSELRVHLPDYMLDAVRRAARREVSNLSTYTRQTLHRRLVEDGLLPREHAEPANEAATPEPANA